MAGYNWVDYILLGVFGFSILAGLLRGGAKEIISVLSWIAAFIVAGLFASQLAVYFTNTQGVQSAISSAPTALGMSAAKQVSLFALSASFVLLFFATLLIGTLIGYFVNRVVESVGLSLINRIIGAVFGCVRGYLIDVLIIFLLQLTPFANQPAWLNSHLVSQFQPAVAWFGNLVQPGLDSLKSKVGQTLEDINSDVKQQSINVFR